MPRSVIAPVEGALSTVMFELLMAARKVRMGHPPMRTGTGAQMFLPSLTILLETVLPQNVASEEGRLCGLLQTKERRAGRPLWEVGGVRPRRSAIAALLEEGRMRGRKGQRREPII